MRKRSKTIAERKIELRKKYWPEISDEMIWDKRRIGGYWSMPRTLPYFFKIMDDLSKGKPLSNTYFTLWCRSFDEMFIEIQNEKLMAFESGFANQRGIYQWRERMKKLTEFGFILVKPGPISEFNYVQILNPYFVVEILRKEKQGPEFEKNFNALQNRFNEVKADQPIEQDTD